MQRMKGLIHRRVGGVPGQSMVELALTIGILLMLVFGGIGVIQVLLTNYTVTSAARTAAHQAAIDGGWTAQAKASATAVLDGAPWTAHGTRQITGGCPSTCRRYSAITVTITYTDKLWTPVPFFRSVTAKASATRAAEQDQGTRATSGAPGGSSTLPSVGLPSAAPQGGPLPCPSGGCP